MHKLVKTSLLSFTVLVGTIALFANTNVGERYFEIAKNLDIFATLFKEVNAYYVDEVEPNALIKTGIDAMLSSLDPYTNYIPEDEIESYRTMTTGQYGGIGALIGRVNGRTLITMPYKGFAAEKAGLKIGDELLTINGVDVKDKNTGEISKLLKGQARTEVEVTVKRYGQSKDMTFKFKREKITVDNVPYHGMLKEDIGYIKLEDFTTGAGKEVGNAFAELKDKGAKKLILDLRGNPGGLLNEAVNVSNVFVDKGAEVVSTKGKIVEWNKVYKALNNPVDTEMPLIVLLDRGSASAAEIVSGVIQDYDRGILVGRRSFGKGLVQTTRPLTYNSQLKVTTAKYYIPSGRCIQAIDYAKRNEDGSVKKIPDSLKVAFKTRNERQVYDGGGLEPDFAIEQFKYAPITISLLTKGLIFEYATTYFYNHDKIAPSKKFAITDQEYMDFVKWLSDKEYDYVTNVEKTIEALEESAKEEKYYAEIKSQIESLKKELNHNKESDLMTFKEEIREALEAEVSSRYYFSKGGIEATFDDDRDIQKAFELFDNPSEYAKTLSGK